LNFVHSANIKNVLHSEVLRKGEGEKLLGIFFEAGKRGRRKIKRLSPLFSLC